MRSKKWKHFLSRTHLLGSFLPVSILSLISINTTEGHMWNCIIFYFFYFLKKKNEMKQDENETCTKKTNNKSIYKKNKKIKTSIFFPFHCPPSSSIHVPFPEIEIKRQLRENFSTTDQDCILRFKLQTIINTDLSLSTCINCLTCLSLSLWALRSSSSFSLLSSSSFFTLFRSALLKI